MIKRAAVMALVGLMALGTGAFADEGKDESGKGKQRREERKRHEGNSSYFHQHARPHSERSLAASGRVPHLVSGQAGRSSTAAVQVRSSARPG